MGNWADMVGTDDRIFIKFEIKNGEALFNVDKPEKMNWAQFMSMLDYLVALGISQETDLTIDEAREAMEAQDMINKGFMTTIEMVFGGKKNAE